MTRDIKEAIGKDKISPELESIINKAAVNFEVIDKNFFNLKERINFLELVV
jgi:hypothetical protein